MAPALYSNAVISIERLTHRFGENTVLDGVTLEVEAGEIVAIMGSSGGGKTTLLRCVSGLLRPTSGKVTVDGIDAVRQPEAARRTMGMVFQASALFDYLSVRENVLFGLRRWSEEPRAVQDRRAEEVLELVGMADAGDLMPSELSGGMKKRVGIARALALRPKIMLYDEPTTGLDPITTYTIDSLIADVRKRFEVTTLVVSHDVASVFRVADRLAFLEDGRLTFVGSPAEFGSSKRAAIEELVAKSQATSFLPAH